MARHERASMREGPLAQLFRKTDEEGDVPAEPQPEPGAAAPATPAGQPQGAGPEPSAPSGPSSTSSQSRGAVNSPHSSRSLPGGRPSGAPPGKHGAQATSWSA